MVTEALHDVLPRSGRDGGPRTDGGDATGGGQNDSLTATS